MLSPLIKKQIEEKYGEPVRYAKSCEGLAAHIYKETNRRISSSTIKRLFGIISGSHAPRAYTLDIIGEFLGFSCYDDLIMQYRRPEIGHRPVIQKIDVAELSTGDKVILGFESEGRLTLVMNENRVFHVLESTCCQLTVGDYFFCQEIQLEYPLFIEQWNRDHQQLGSCVLAKVSGISSIELN
jgi:hypothetical protein